MSQKKKIDHTIFINTKNRTKWLEYSLMHYKNFNYRGEIKILDDSDSEFFINNSKLIQKFLKDLNIEHIRGDGCDNNTPRHKNCTSGLSKNLRNITTSYYSHAPDDDVLFIPSLESSISFLEQNPSYSAVSGNHLIIYLDDLYNFKKKIIYFSQTCHYEDPIDRLTCYAQESGIITYGVIRTRARQALWDLENKIGWPIFARKNTHGIEYFDEELPWVAQVYISGKIASLNLIQTIRLKSDLIDRVELAFKGTSPKNNMVLGNVSGLMNKTLEDSCIETFKEFRELVNYVKSKYDPDIVDYQIKQVIWSLINGYDGAGLNRNQIEYSINYKKKKDKIITLNISNFLKIFNLRKLIKYMSIRLSFRIKMYINMKKFKRDHDRFKKIFFV
tara:strand:+ start:57 stop:1220 length:1164 start_codon:yes stop_codon:yes gene_type:complete